MPVCVCVCFISRDQSVKFSEVYSLFFTLSVCMCVQVVSLVLTAYRSHLASSRASAESDSSEVGEGGDDGDLQPGRSIVFVSLEVSLSAIVRTFPMLSPQHVNTALGGADQSHTRALQRSAAVSTLEASLAVSAASILTSLPDLCTGNGSVAVLPTLLFLLTGMLCEACVLDSKGQQRLPTVSASCLQALKTVASSAFARSGPVSERWQSMLVSAMLTVVEAAEQQDTPRDPSVMLLSLAVFVQSVPPEVASHPAVQSRTITLLTKSFSHEKIEVS